jgi:hypothetical protein
MFALDRHDGVTVCLLESHEHVEHLELSIEVARVDVSFCRRTIGALFRYESSHRTMTRALFDKRRIAPSVSLRIPLGSFWMETGRNKPLLASGETAPV